MLYWMHEILQTKVCICLIILIPYIEYCLEDYLVCFFTKVFHMFFLNQAKLYVYYLGVEKLF